MHTSLRFDKLQINEHGDDGDDEQCTSRSSTVSWTIRLERADSVVTNTVCLVFKYFAKYSTKLSI